MHAVLARQYLAVRNFYVRTTSVPMQTFDAVTDTQLS